MNTKEFNRTVKLFALNGMVFNLDQAPSVIHIFGYDKGYDYYPKRNSLRDLRDNVMTSYDSIESMIELNGHDFRRSKEWRKNKTNEKLLTSQRLVNKLQKDLQKKKEECSITHDESLRVTRFLRWSALINVILFIYLLFFIFLLMEK